MICVFYGNSVAFSEWQISKDESGVKLLRFLQSKLGSAYSLRAIKRAIEQNLCLVNGRVEHFASTLLGAGDRVVFYQELLSAPLTSNKQAPIEVAYEDEDFLFINKPAGLSSEDPSLLAKLKTQTNSPYLTLAHRLDKETSGVLCLVKSARAKEALYHLFKSRMVFKSYYAIVDNLPQHTQGRIENYLGKIASYHGQNLWGAVAKDKGILAITKWKVVKKGKSSALLNCLPLTGRTHQIRVHLAGMGHPILGDKQYGKNFTSPLRPKRCLLHSAEMAFTHPFTQAKLKVSVPLPDDFSSFL